MPGDLVAGEPDAPAHGAVTVRVVPVEGVPGGPQVGKAAGDAVPAVAGRELRERRRPTGEQDALRAVTLTAASAAGCSAE